MALSQQDSAELRNDTTTEEERASSSSSSEAHERATGAKRQQADDGAAATPPPTQQMDRYSSSSSDDEAAADPGGGRIPAEVFERDDPAAAANNKDWSMMSTDSVFGLQTAPSSDFTGFVLAHPELMDFVSTPPRASTASADVLVPPPFESIPPELSSEASMNGNHSFAFPNLIEDKRHSSKKVQDEQTTEAVRDEPEPAPAQAESQASSKPEAAAPAKEAAAKGGLFACFPCCS